MPKTNMDPAWRKQRLPVNRQRRHGRVALVCDDPSLGAYSRALQALGWTVVQGRLFETRALAVAEPAAHPALLVLPSVKAVRALAAQAWFEAARPRLRALAPGPQTAAALRSLGLEPVWVAERGFRGSSLPPALRAEPKLYLGEASLGLENLSLPLSQADAFLPLYQQVRRPGAPWPVRDSQGIVTASTLLVLANSRRQLSAVEAQLRMLGSKAPARRFLVAMSYSIAMSGKAGYWEQISFPDRPNRESLLDHLRDLHR